MNKALFLIPTFLALATGSLFADTNVYFESFSSRVYGPVSNGAAQWHGYYGATATAGASGASDIHRSGIASGPSEPAMTNGSYLFAQNYDTTEVVNYFLFSTSTVTPFAPATYPQWDATWLRTGDSATYRLSIQVDSASWYATTTTVTTGGAPSINLMTAQWYPITFTAGSNLSLDTVSLAKTYGDLFGAGQSVTGVGYYLDSLEAGGTGNYKTIRFDSLTITVPEPAGALLLALGAGIIAARRRRQ